MIVDKEYLLEMSGDSGVSVKSDSIGQTVRPEPYAEKSYVENFSNIIREVCIFNIEFFCQNL